MQENQANFTSDLSLFPKPSVAVDLALMSVLNFGGSPTLVALAHRRTGDHAHGEWALPGRILRERETLEECADAAIEQKLGLNDRVELRQLQVFDDPDRDPRGWVLSVAHIGTLATPQAERLIAMSSEVGPIVIDGDHFEFPNSQTDLPYEQRAILKAAVKELRKQYAVLPDPGHFLDEEFTLLQLREVHEAVHSDDIQPDTFRREMLPNLEATGRYQEGGVGKPPMLYRRIERSQSSVPSPSRSTITRRRLNADEVL